ncbi:helix-turn-helix transcriptional regulator [Oceanisphaera sp. IT1-181]|uniref:response regulator transcription factor n=1 Tax=Oceanisphaera sp. IT1-181 TaxID=3081199 RepID=UPI0029CA19C9|nr:helix-turn-helix transcriptional regulator [Oceanisphaera sp. IT1-181]
MSISNENKQQALAEAIEAIGTVAFARRLAKLVNSYVDSDCCLILSYQAAGSAVYLYDNLADKRELLFSEYLNGIYAQDPFYRALRHGLNDGVYSLSAVMQQQGVNDPDYMADFYQATGWQQELGIVLALNEQQWLTLFLGRLTATPFSGAEQQELRQLLPILSALCRQHWPKGAETLAQSPAQRSIVDVTVPSTLARLNTTDSNTVVSTTMVSTAMVSNTTASMRVRVEQALISFGQSRLTPREQQVAMLLVQGQDNAAIAQQLDIGEGTVKNHRKHLYAKLAIDSQAALFARFMNHLITYDSAPSTKRPAPSSTSNL